MCIAVRPAVVLRFDPVRPSRFERIWHRLVVLTHRFAVQSRAYSHYTKAVCCPSFRAVNFLGFPAGSVSVVPTADLPSPYRLPYCPCAIARPPHRLMHHWRHISQASRYFTYSRRIGCEVLAVLYRLSYSGIYSVQTRLSSHVWILFGTAHLPILCPAGLTGALSST